MITYQNTKTIRDLVLHAGRKHGERIFLRYEDNDVMYDVTSGNLQKNAVRSPPG